jgi:hypothetical protein
VTARTAENNVICGMPFLRFLSSRSTYPKFVEREAAEKRRSASHSAKFAERGRKGGAGPGVRQGVRYAQ